MRIVCSVLLAVWLLLASGKAPLITDAISAVLNSKRVFDKANEAVKKGGVR